SPQSPELRANSYTSGDQQQAVVASDATGNFVIAWTSSGHDGRGGTDIYAQRFNAAGTKLGTEFLVNSDFAENEFNPAIAMDDNGDFVIAWSSLGGSGYDVYAQRYNSSGVAQGGNFLVNAPAAADRKQAAVAMDATGDFVVAWTAYQQDLPAGGGDIYARK